MVYLLAAVVIGLAQSFVVAAVRPRPSGLLEVVYLMLPVVGVAVLLVLAWCSVSG